MCSGPTSNWSSAEVGALRKARKEFWESWCLTPTDKQHGRRFKTIKGLKLGQSQDGSEARAAPHDLCGSTSAQPQLLHLLLQPVDLGQQLLVLALRVLQFAGRRQDDRLDQLLAALLFCCC